MTKPSLSKHLRILEGAGLVASEKRGQFVHYRLADANLLGSLHNLLATFCPVGGPLKKESARRAESLARHEGPPMISSTAHPADPRRQVSGHHEGAHLGVPTKKGPSTW